MVEHKSFVTTTKGMRGWFAVLVWWNPESGGFWEPWQSGIGSFDTKDGAVVEAKVWAEAEGLKYEENMPNG